MAKKEYKIETNCTADQKKKICERAEKYGMKVAEFLLYCALNTEMNASVGKTLDSFERDLEFAENYHKRNGTSSEEFARVRQVIILNHEKSAGVLRVVKMSEKEQIKETLNRT